MQSDMSSASTEHEPPEVPVDTVTVFPSLHFTLVEAAPAGFAAKTDISIPTSIKAVSVAVVRISASSS
jgi:hypothetical protein